MSPPHRVELLQAFTAAWNAKDPDALMALMSDDCHFRASVGPEPGLSFHGREEVRRGFERFLGGDSQPPPETVLEPSLICEEFAVTRWRVHWPGSPEPMPEVRGCDVFVFSGDRIALKDTYRKVIAP